MGVTGAGKSSFISLLCDQKIEIGHDLQACTSSVDVYVCNLYPNQTIYLVDTPGFDDTNRSDTEVLREIAGWLTDSYSKDVKLNGIIYFHRISDIRMQGSAKKNLALFKKLCGENALKNVVLATSMWDKVPRDEAQKREDQLKSTPEFWGWMMSKGSKTYRHNNTKESARNLLKHFLPMDKTVLALQDDMVNKNKTLDETGAGKELEEVLAREREIFARELQEARAQLLEAMKLRDQDSMEAIRELQSGYEAHMRRLEKDRQELKISMEKLHQERYNQLEAKMTEQQEKLRQIQEEKQRIQEEKHRMEMEGLRQKHEQELARAKDTITKLMVSRSGSPDDGSESLNSSNSQPVSANGNAASNHRPVRSKPPDHAVAVNSTEVDLALAAKMLEQNNLQDRNKAGHALVEVKSQCGWAALHQAAENGRIEVARLLIERGTKVNVKSQKGWTALHLAAENGHIEMVKFLIERGAEVKAKSQKGWTALHLAAENGHIEMVKFLIEHGVAINTQSGSGMTALHQAARNGHIKMVKFLIERGAEVKAKSQEGWTALHLAAEKGHIEMVKFLIEHGVAINTQSESGMTALHQAAMNGHIEMVKFLIERGAEVKAKSQKGWTALHLAAENGHIEMVKFLIEHGVAINTQSGSGMTALHQAARNGHIEMVKFLIERGAEVKAKSQKGWTALHLAAEKGHIEMVKFLIEHGVAINMQSQDGRTALHLAEQNGHIKVVGLLVERGGEVKHRLRMFRRHYR